MALTIDGRDFTDDISGFGCRITRTSPSDVAELVCVVRVSRQVTLPVRINVGTPVLLDFGLINVFTGTVREVATDFAIIGGEAWYRVTIAANGMSTNV